ncbi:hypothetical protein BHE74_00023620 [Ensete ventricosum]|nr:hypothetical protein BHE74_00023620 [Ensete ventricosum]
MSLSRRGGATVATEEDGAAAWQQRWQRRPSAAAFEAANGAEVVEGNHHKVTIEGRDRRRLTEDRVMAAVDGWEEIEDGSWAATSGDGNGWWPTRDAAAIIGAGEKKEEAAAGATGSNSGWQQ